MKASDGVADGAALNDTASEAVILEERRQQHVDQRQGKEQGGLQKRHR